MITNKSRIQRKISISLNKKKLSSLHKTNNEIEVLTKLAAKNPKITKLGLAPVTNSPTAKVFFFNQEISTFFDIALFVHHFTNSI